MLAIAHGGYGCGESMGTVGDGEGDLMQSRTETNALPRYLSVSGSARSHRGHGTAMRAVGMAAMLIVAAMPVGISRMDFFQSDQVARAIQGIQVNIGHAAHLDVVERDGTFYVGDAGGLVERCLAYVCRIFIDTDAQVGSPARTGKFNKDISHIFNTFAKFLKSGLRTAYRYGVIAL